MLRLHLLARLLLISLPSGRYNRSSQLSVALMITFGLLRLHLRLLRKLRLSLLHHQATASIKASILAGTKELLGWLSRTLAPMSRVP